MTTVAIADRFWEHVDTTGGAFACWPWLAGRIPEGYGELIVNGAHVGAHRRSYELTIGPIPAGLQIDHLCGHPWCVNPGHLEAVTPRVNVLRSGNPTAINARKATCLNGHPFDIQLGPHRRRCRRCATARQRGYRAARRAREQAAA